jgi:1-aminocyclopropane-1-carboxylate deaminase
LQGDFLFSAFRSPAMSIDLPIYSPLEQLRHELFDQKGVEVWLKRDDLIHPFISGNKWRKLKYHLLAARGEGREHLVTFGGAYSNHLLAAACAAAKFGFSSTAFLRGEPVDNDTIFLCRMFGMELIFVSRDAYRDKDQLFKSAFGNDPAAYCIPEGGGGEAALRGCSELLDETGGDFTHIVTAAGTGTTAAGILRGIAERKFSTALEVVAVLKGDFLEEMLQGSRYMPPVAVRVHTDHHFGGYAKTTPELTAFITKFARTTGILLDPVYTGKMMFAVFDRIASGMFPAGSRILALHTGGLFGLFGKKDQFLKSDEYV